MTISDKDRSYVAWQNRFLDFYIAARVSQKRRLFAPAAFCANQSIEQLLKATLVYWDKSFKPEDHGHAVAKMARMVANRVPEQQNFSVPEYFYYEKRYQSVTRYPNKGKGVLIPAGIISDLDALVADLVEMMPFQFNSQLYHTLIGKNWEMLIDLRRGNAQMSRLRRHVGARLRFRNGKRLD